MTWIASTALAIAVLAFLFGIITEYRQRREINAGKPIAAVATLPFAWQSTAATFLGMAMLPYASWQMAVLTPIVVCAMGTGLIVLAGQKRKCP